MSGAVPAQRLQSLKSELHSSVHSSEGSIFRPIVDANHRFRTPSYNLLKTWFPCFLVSISACITLPEA